MSLQWQEMLDAHEILPVSVPAPLRQLDAFASDVSQVSLIDLSYLSVYEITGNDATAFLQGQFCNDISHVSSAQAQITGYCTPKGRLLALPTLAGFDKGYRLIVPCDVGEAFIKRLGMFVMRSDVTIEKLDDWVAVGVTTKADGSAGELLAADGALPADQLAVSSESESQLLRWHDDISGSLRRARYLRIGTYDNQLAMWQKSEGVNRYSAHAWRLADISAGVPSISASVVEAFVPQMINLQLINALSFTKGCYPGQEIVARMQYLGKLKRQMQIFSMPIPSDLESQLCPGAALTASDDQNAGIVVDAMPASNGTCLVLAVTKVAVDNNGFNIDGLALEPVDMPYALAPTEVA